MTYRCCELYCGANVPIRNDGINWKNLSAIVPCDENWNEIEVASKEHDLRYWNKQVLDFRIEGNTMYCRLEL